MAPRDDHPPHSDEADTTSNLFANSVYSLSVEKQNEIMKMLRDCGTDIVMPLPKIAVIGNQSAGKSSLIEAISKIKLPRSKGTTTRCPMEVRLSRTKDPNGTHYTVSIRYENPLDVPAGRQRTSKFCDTQDPNEIPLLIRRAQLAILNPSTDAKTILALDEGQCEKHPSELAFSRNMVVIEITNADVDLTFIDLPGIIANTPNVYLSLEIAYVLLGKG
jgi:GTPase SAR1 family protein